MKIVIIVPRREEFLACEVIKGLHRKGVELITTDSLQNIRNLYASCSSIDIGAGDIPDTVEYSDDEVVEHSKSADYIFVLGSKFAKPSDMDFGGKLYLLDRINQPDKTVFIDGSEYSWTGHRTDDWCRVDINSYKKGTPWIDHTLRNKVKWYFKRETYPDDVTEHNIIPCPYPFRIEDRQTPQNKTIGLVCAFGQLSTGLREDVEKACRTIKHDLPILVDKLPGGRFNFLNILSKSYMAVDAWGGGDCTVRKNEAIMNSVALCKQAWGILEPYPFEDGKSIITYSTVGEFLEKTNYYLNNLDKLVEIGKNGYEHALQYHTTEKRINYIFDVINNKIEWK